MSLSDDSVDAAFRELTDENPLVFTRLHIIQLPTAAQFRAIPLSSECMMVSGNGEMFRGIMDAEGRERFAEQAESHHGHLHAMLIYVAPEVPASTLASEDAEGLETAEEVADAMVERARPALMEFMSARLRGENVSALDVFRTVLVDTAIRARNGMARLPF